MPLRRPYPAGEPTLFAHLEGLPPRHLSEDERRRARQTSRRAPIPRPETVGDTKPSTMAEVSRIPETPPGGTDGVGLAA
jgi:hypothetical protein